MSRAHEEAASLLEGMLRASPEDEPVSKKQIDLALDRIEELSKEVQTYEDEEYLASVAETLLGLRAHAAGHEKTGWD